MVKAEDAKMSTTAISRTGHRLAHSGLSALIQAATSQLGHLAEGATKPECQHRIRFTSVASSDDGAGSDCREGRDQPTGTPTMMSETDPRKQSFPQLLMTLALDPENIDTIAFLPDGKFFAIRSHEFSETHMMHYFSVSTFEEFLDVLHDWGFSRLVQEPNSSSGIEVFRHPKFVKGDWGKCERIKFGESPTDARVSALPERAKIEYCVSEDSSSNVNSNASNGSPESAAAISKRRLSPGFLARRESESSVTSQKLKVGTAESEAGDSHPAEGSHASKSDELRSIALSITTEKLNLKPNGKEQDDDGRHRGKLVDRAVESATQVIVTDAIESLLRDEDHSKQTYLKHEKELSTSTIPGVVPISKQLFSADATSSNGHAKEDSSPIEVTISTNGQSLRLSLKDGPSKDGLPPKKASADEPTQPPGEKVHE